MDPTAKLCLLTSSFSKKKNVYIPPTPLKLGTPTKIVYKPIFSNNIPPNVYVSSVKEKKLKEMGDKIKDIESEKFGKFKFEINPFEGIGRSMFVNRAAVKLANLDAIFDLTGSRFGDLARLPQGDDQEFTFCDIASAPGGFTEYIQYRKDISVGYGISLHPDYGGIPWSPKSIQFNGIHRFSVEWGDSKYGGDGSGNLYTNSSPFSRKVLAFHPNGVDLVVGDGGFSVKGMGVPRENALFRLIMNEFLIGIKTLKKGGHFACKIFSTKTLPMAGLLYIMASCFEETYLIKPNSSRTLSAEKFIVCKGYKRGETNEQIYTLEKANYDFEKAKLYNINQLLEEQNMPTKFIKDLENYNNIYTENITKNLMKIHQLMEGKNPHKTDYNISRFHLLWDIPSYTETPR